MDNKMSLASSTSQSDQLKLDSINLRLSTAQNEQDLKYDPILHYASKVGLLAENHTQDQDFVLLLGYGIDQKKYVYNQKSGNLTCHDRTGTTDYNKREKDKEKLILIYELKKLYLHKNENIYTQKLKDGQFYYDNLVEYTSSKKKFLEARVKCVDQVIHILNEQDCNYGRSFGEQVHNFVRDLYHLKHFSDQLSEAEWHAEVVKLINWYYSQGSEFSEDKNVAHGNKEKRCQYVIECTHHQSEGFKMKSIDQLKNCSEYSELNKLKPEGFFGDLIRDIKHMTFVKRKEQIERELNKTKYIDEEIRNKQNEIRKTHGDFSEDYQISDIDEKRYERLLKAQQARTNREYRDGLIRTKERTDEDTIKNAIMHCKYDEVCEAKDVEDLTQTIQKQYLRIKTKEDDIAHKVQETIYLREDRIPSLEEERDLWQIIIEKLNCKLTTLNIQAKEYQGMEKQEKKNISEMTVDNVRYTVEIQAHYQTLSAFLTDIEKLKTELEELRNAKSGVRKDEIDAFKNSIFEKAGGQKKGYSDTGFVNHVDCQPDLPLGTDPGHCLYRAATDLTVQFAVNQVEEGKLDLNEAALFDHLKGYKHSANNGTSESGRGKGKHAPYLKEAYRHVFLEYHDVEKRIKQRENEYQIQISTKEDIKQRKEKQRKDVREIIIEKENILNDGFIKLNEAERETERLVRLMCASEDQTALINDFIEAAQSLQSTLSEKIDSKEAEISELVYIINQQNESIDEVNTEINKEGEYNQALAWSEARWKYSKYERIITSIGDVEKQKIEHKRLEKENNKIEETLKANIEERIEFKAEKLKTKRSEIMQSSDTIERLVNEKNNLIATQSRLETESHIGLVNTIEEYRKNIEKIEDHKNSEIKEMNKTRAEIIRRQVYETIDIKQKGTTKNDEDFPEDIGTVNQLYKKRRHKDCQDNFNTGSQTCKYFDAVDIITKLLLETVSKSNDAVFTELRSKHENYTSHVFKVHEQHIKKCTSIIRDKIEKFNKKVEETKIKYTKQQEKLNEHMTHAKERLIKKKKHDGVIVVKDLTFKQQDIQNIPHYLKAGVDCVAIDMKEIYTSKHLKLTTEEFSKKIIAGYNLQMNLTPKEVLSELEMLFKSRRPVAMEMVLLQEKDTNQKKLYTLLVHYFAKIYLKKKLELVEQLKNQEVQKCTERDIMRAINKLDREIETLFTTQSTVKEIEDINCKMLNMDSHVPPTLNKARGEIKRFEVMKTVCLELLVGAKKEIEKKTEEIRQCTQQIKGIKSSLKSVNVNVDALNSIKFTIVKNRLKIGLHNQLNQHRVCAHNENDCNFFQHVVTLIDYAIIELQNSQTPHPNKLIRKLELSHSEKHKAALRRIITYVTEEYEHERNKVLSRRKQQIQKLEWKIAEIESYKDATNQILIPQLEKRIEEVENFLIFMKDISFVEKHSEKDDSTQKELQEYKELKFKAVFKHQVDYLIRILSVLKRRLGREIKVETRKSIINCIYNVFKEYYNTLNADSSLIRTLISKLEQELIEEYHESKLKTLMMKKRTQMGGVEYIFKKISWMFQQTQQGYNQLLDPDKIYYKALLEEAKRKEIIMEASLEKLQKDLLTLEAQKKELSIQDNSLLREELENIHICIRYSENAKEVAGLRNRMEEINDSRSNKDDYYSFEMDNKRVCVRLLNVDPVMKSAEIKQIDRIRDYVAEQNCKLLEQRVLREVYDRELKEDVDKEFKSSFMEIQRKLMVKGISLCGYDAFENGESLNEINSCIAVIIGVLIEEDCLYRIGSVNQVSSRVEVWTRKIRSKYNEFVASKGFQNEDGITEGDQLQFIKNLVNEEFKTDNLFISQINVLKNKQTNNPRGNGPNVTLLIQNAKYFALVPRDKIKIYKANAHREISIKITYILAVLQAEEDLFKYLCERRFQNVLQVKLEQSKNLAEVYKREKTAVAKISSLKEFNALFCNTLDLTDTSGSLSIFLFVYLSHLENLENRLKNDDPQDKAARLKIVKSFYDRVLFTLIKTEQNRRQKRNATVVQESREELYLKEMIQNGEEELSVLLQEINKQEEKIENDQNLVNSLLFEKEKSRDKYQEKMEQLSNIRIDLKEKLNCAQENIRQLNKNKAENQEKIKEAQAEVGRLDVALAEVEKEIKLKENDKEALEINISNLKERAKGLESDLKRVNAEKERKEKQEAEKKKEILASKDVVQLIANLKVILGNAKLQSKKENIKKSIYKRNTLGTLLEELRKELQRLPVENTNFWQLLMKDINYEQLKNYINSDKKIAGELQHQIVNRIRAVVRSAVNTECEIVHEFANGKPIKRFKLLAANTTYKDVHRIVKELVEKEMHSSDDSRGLRFDENVLHSTDHGVTGIQYLPNKLKTVVEKRIELQFKSEEVESKKNGRFKDAAKTINELKIDYKDVVLCYVDEIEVIVSGRFILNDSPSYAGIDLTINAVDMECVGENLMLDVSGKPGVKFRYKASPGKVKRTNNTPPRGDKGYDGYDGDNGGHGGNIVIKTENTIINLGALKSIKTNGGNGGEGQLGGDGDEGLKGVDGQNGKADDTNSLGGGQTTIGFGNPGTPGGCGGDPGYTGRPGMGGKAGVIYITHKAGKITFGEMNHGQDADNILDKSKPMGGNGGEPGLYGFDEIRQKKNFFCKTVTLNTAIDRAALVKKYPKFREQIVASENVKSTNHAVLVGTILFGVTGFVVGAFIDSKLSYEEKDNPTDYRNRDKNLENKRGRKNEEEARLRSDCRTPQEQKRDEVNIDSLHGQLNEKKRIDEEIAGGAQHKESIYDLMVEQEELIGDIENCTQEASNIQCEIENVSVEIESKTIELDKVLEDISSLRNKDSSLNSERTTIINKIIREIRGCQNARDKIGTLNLNMTQELSKLEKYNALGDEFCGNKDDLVRIIDEYLDAIKARLRRSRQNLKFLQKNVASKKSDIKTLTKNLEDMHHERLSQIVTEAEIEQEIEEEAETQHVEEITNVIDRDVHLTTKFDNKQEINRNSYIATENLFDVQNVPNNISDIKFILNQSVRHYRAGVEDDARVTSIIDAISKNSKEASFISNDLKVVVDTYKKEIRKVRTANNIDTLSSIERNLLLDQLKKINIRLNIDNLANLHDYKNIEVFVFKMMQVIDKDEKEECSTATKLQRRFEGNHLLDNDKLKDDVESLISIIEDRKTFYVEKCAINFSKMLTEGKECEKIMLDYNKTPNLENLVSLVSKFKVHQEKLLNTQEEKKYLSKSVEGFVSTVIENIRYHGILALIEIIENESKCNKYSVESPQKQLYEQMIATITDSIITIHGISDATKQLVIQIQKVINLFSKGVKNLKVAANSKKEANRAIQSLKGVTNKLLKYIDLDRNHNPSPMNMIVNDYFHLVDTELVLDMKCVESFSEWFDCEEEAIWM